MEFKQIRNELSKWSSAKLVLLLMAIIKEFPFIKESIEGIIGEINVHKKR